MEEFRQPYTILASQVDKALTVLDGMIAQQEFDWFHIIQIQDLLRRALLEAETRYIEDGEKEPDCRLIVLPPQKQ